MSGPVAAGLALAAPLVLAAVVEPRLYLAADRAPDRRGFVRAGMLACALACAVAVVAPAWAFALVLVAASPLWGVGTGVAQVALVERAEAAAGRLLTRWTLAGEVGDVAAPALLAAAALAGLDWRAGFVAAGAVALAIAVALPPLPRAGAGPSDDEADDPDAPRTARAALAAVARTPRLAGWIAGVVACSLLDEIVVAFVALDLAARLDAGPAARALVIGAFLGGGVLGLLVQDRVLARAGERRVLIAISATCALAHAGWLLAPGVAVSAALAALVGATAAGQYPLAMAAAYRASPGRPGLVGATLAVLTPIDVVLPVGLALLAEAAGVRVALALLIVQPLALLALAVWVPPAPRT